MLSRGEPPICVGLYARWGSGKTFMIHLLKKAFDDNVREDPHTRQLLQFFEEGYAGLEPSQDSESETMVSLISVVLRTILLSLIPTLPYWVSTFSSIIWDVFGIKQPKAKTSDSGEGDQMNHDCLSSMKSVVRGPYQKLGQEPKEKECQVLKKEFVFVHFNAWECAAFSSSCTP